MPPRPVNQPYHPPEGAGLFEKIWWILSHPASWMPLLKEYWLALAIIAVFTTIMIYLAQWVSKYYVLKKVYLKGEKDKRMPRYIGRQILFIKKDTPLLGRFAPDVEGIKGVMLVRDPASRIKFWGGRNLRIYVPDYVKYRSKADRTVLYKSDIKYDYNKFHAYIPTSETFEAVKESEQTFYNLIKEKIDETDTKVQKAINCNPEIVKDQKKSGSIPLSAEQDTKPSKRGKIMEGIDIEESEEESATPEPTTDRSMSKQERVEAVKERLGRE